MCIIWLRRYPTMHHLSAHFSIPVSCVRQILHQMLKNLHVYLVPKYIKWHTMRQWRQLAGFYPEWPRVVAILGCTPFQISKPKGNVLGKGKWEAFMLYLIHTCIWVISLNGIFSFLGPIQRIFYRGDRYCHFLNWLVIVDVLGTIVLSRPGYIGRTSNSTCLRYKWHM